MLGVFCFALGIVVVECVLLTILCAIDAAVRQGGAFSGFDKGGSGKVSAKEQSSPPSLRIQNLDLICRHDFNFRLPFVKFNCAGDADGFPVDHG